MRHSYASRHHLSETARQPLNRQHHFRFSQTSALRTGESQRCSTSLGQKVGSSPYLEGEAEEVTCLLQRARYVGHLPNTILARRYADPYPQREKELKHGQVSSSNEHYTVRHVIVAVSTAHAALCSASGGSSTCMARAYQSPSSFVTFFRSWTSRECSGSPARVTRTIRPFSCERG